MTNEIVMQKSKSILMDVDKFEFAQRVGKMLAQSTMVPEHFRNNIGNCLIAMNYADRCGLDIFMVMQKMYVIKGKPAIEAQLQIAIFNQSEKFSTMKYKLEGEGDNRTCTAYATDLQANEILYGPPVSIRMAKAEGWYGKTGSKWQTLPDLMLRYRAASFFIRTYAPETTFGINTRDEFEDSGIIDVTPEKDGEFQAEVSKNANQEMIDMSVFDNAEPEKQDNSGGLTDDEKAEIEAAEMEESKSEEGPGF